MRFGGGGGGVFKTLGIRPTAKQYRLAAETVGGAHVVLITGSLVGAPRRPPLPPTPAAGTSDHAAPYSRVEDDRGGERAGGGEEIEKKS